MVITGWLGFVLQPLGDYFKTAMHDLRRKTPQGRLAQNGKG